jgi:hypothetical protein
MKTSDKLYEAFDKFRPHINGHRTAMNLFLEALKEVEEMEQELSKLHQPAVSGELPMSCVNDFEKPEYCSQRNNHLCQKCKDW